MSQNKQGPATRQPKQSRSQKTVEKILDATAEILSDKGYDGLNTNAVAKLAAVNIATLYNYFPNKQALLEQLLQRFNEQQMTMVIAELQTNPDKDERVGYILDAQLAMVLERPWMNALNQAMRASPTLKSVREKANRQMINMVIEQIPPEMGRPKTKGKQLHAILSLLLETFSSGIQLIANAPKQERKALMKELKCLINSYLNHYR